MPLSASALEESRAATKALLERVTVVVVTYNSAHCLPALAHLLRHCPHVRVVDNASADGCAAAATALLPHASVQALERNLGFGAANNRGLERVQTEFALLLNPDCELEPAALAQLVRSADAYPEAAVVAPQLTDPRGKAEINYRWPHTLWPSKGPAATGAACVGFVCGAAMLLRLARFADIGFFDERFFLYYEDDDLCLRLFQLQRPMILDPACSALHRSRGSVRGPSPWRSEYWRGYHHAQSKLIFSHKHLSPQQALRQRRRLLLGTALNLPLRLLLLSPRLLARMWGRLRGTLDWKAS
ncbi:MAG: glycosyltransferase family 2 protein [Serpentinimonas sp.]|nr:glycosyltransferase family 2 protein [Serpentinimonas sp.]